MSPEKPDTTTTEQRGTGMGHVVIGSSLVGVVAVANAAGVPASDLIKLAKDWGLAVPFLWALVWLVTQFREEMSRERHVHKQELQASNSLAETTMRELVSTLKDGRGQTDRSDNP